MIRIALTAVVVVTLAVMAAAIEDRSAERDQADAMDRQQREADRVERVIREVCGENAGYRINPDGLTATCTTKRGHVRKTVARIQ